MADSFADQLHSELASIQVELERLATKRRLIEELLGVESTADDASTPAKLAGRRRGPQPAKRARRPRGLITGTIREFLSDQPEPVHGTEILAYLERQDAAPLSAKPMANLQSALQRLKEQGEIENTGRNRWRLRATASLTPHREARRSGPLAPLLLCPTGLPNRAPAVLVPAPGAKAAPVA